MYDPIGDFQVIVGDCEFTQGMSFEFDIYVKQVGTPRTISSMLVTRSDDGSAIASSQLRIIGTPSGSQVNTFMVRGVYLDGSWKVCVQIV